MSIPNERVHAAKVLISQIPTLTAERIYAVDYLNWRAEGEDGDRPDVGDYKLGGNVAEAIRDQVDRCLADPPARLN